MNTKLASLFHLLITATMISATAGCASVQTVFAPGMVAEAKSAGNESSYAEDFVLVPGSVDLSISSNASRPAYSGALVPGSTDLSRTLIGAAAFDGEAPVPAGAYLPRARR